MNVHLTMSVFIAVSEEEGFAAAARALGMSTSAVTRHVQELEQKLGTPLLRRTTRRLSLTEAGELYLPRARALLTQIDELHEEVSSLGATPRGRLRVTASPDFGDYFLAPMVARFAKIYPEMALVMNFTTRVVDLVAEGYDAGVRAGRLKDSSLRMRRIAEVRYLVCASPEYLTRCGAPERPEDLTRHQCLHWRWQVGMLIWRFRDGDDDAAPAIEVPVSGRFLVASVLAERAGALEGLGLAMLPKERIMDDLKAGRLVQVLEEFPPVPEPITIVWPAAQSMPRKLRLFIDFLTDEFGKLERLEKAYER